MDFTKKMKEYTLYYFPTCPYCVKVLAFMKLKGITIDLKNTRADTSAHDALVKGGGKHQVPCLRITTDASDDWMYESDAIIEHFSS